MKGLCRKTSPAFKYTKPGAGRSIQQLLMASQLLSIPNSKTSEHLIFFFFLLSELEPGSETRQNYLNWPLLCSQKKRTFVIDFRNSRMKLIKNVEGGQVIAARACCFVYATQFLNCTVRTGSCLTLCIRR